MTFLTVALVVALVFWAVALGSTFFDARAVVRCAGALPPRNAPEVVAIVPARNEAHQIEACLRSLLAQDWPRLRVICVDDRSDDATFAVASAIADPRLTVVRGHELAAGWLGKNFANAQGVECAGTAPWLLFTDADSVHAPAALASAHAAAVASGAGLFTLFTELRTETFWEKALLPTVISSVVRAFPLRHVNNPRSKIAIANGQYLLFRRDAYEAVGGHGAIRDRVADDLELSRLVKSRGLGLRAEDGRALCSVRMYTSLRELWWGFVKNASAGAGGAVPALLGAVFLLVTTVPFFALPFVRGPLLALAAAGCVVALAQRMFAMRELFSLPLWWALTLPLGQMMFAGIVAHSAVRQLSGRGPSWKGRAYPKAR